MVLKSEQPVGNATGQVISPELERYPLRWVYSTRQQATMWSLLTSRKGGSSMPHISMATGQRGWKRQPPGGFNGLGTSPCRMMRSLLRVGSGMGRAEHHAWVEG